MGAFVNLIRAKLGLEPKRDKTVTGKTPNEVKINRPLSEATQKYDTVVFAPARMNPPTPAHGQIVDTVKKAAAEYNAPHHIVLTRTHDTPTKRKVGSAIRNPLSPEQKLKHAQRFFPDANVRLADKDKPNLLSQLSDLHDKGHDHVVMVAGSDRIPEYKRLVDMYNGKSGPHGYFNFKKVTFRSAGERDPEAEGIAGWSATKSRQSAEGGNYDHFKKNAVPSHLHDKHAQELYHDLRGGMGINEAVGFDMAGSAVPAVPTINARDIQGKKSPLTPALPPSKKGNTGYDSDLETNKEMDHVNLSRRRELKRAIQGGQMEGYDQSGDDLTQSPTVYPVTTTPVPSFKPKIKSFKAAMKEGLFSDTNVPGESGSPQYGSDVDTSSNDTMVRTEKKPKKRMEEKACWSGYKMVGMKKGRKGNPVPNCVPANEQMEHDIRSDDNHECGHRGDMLKRGTRVILKKDGYQNMKGNIDQYDVMHRKYVVSVDRGGSNLVVDADDVVPIKEAISQNYRAGLSDSTAKAREAHWKRMAKYSDRDPRAYQPAPGDATAKTKPSKYTLAYHAKFGEEVELDEAAASALADKAKKSGISVGTLRKVYRRGVAAWNSGHRPGTTPQQWGMARVNSYISHGKGTYGGADKDLHEGEESLVERVIAIMERGADSKGLYRPTEKGAGLTRKGAKHFGIKTAVTTPPSKLDPNGKAAKRRKSFCARMGGMKGPMKDEKGRPTRKAMSLRRWNCEETDKGDTL